MEHQAPPLSIDVYAAIRRGEREYIDTSTFAPTADLAASEAKRNDGIYPGVCLGRRVVRIARIRIQEVGPA